MKDSKNDNTIPKTSASHEGNSGATVKPAGENPQTEPLTEASPSASEIAAQRADKKSKAEAARRAISTAQTESAKAHRIHQKAQRDPDFKRLLEAKTRSETALKKLTLDLQNMAGALEKAKTRILELEAQVKPPSKK